MATPTEDDKAFDLEAQWPEARWFNGPEHGPVEPLWIMPVLLLYTGFFFGPFVTVLAAIVSMKGRIALRHASVLVGVAGTCWCLMQGLSILYGPLWSEYALQGMRSGLNFVNGIVAYISVRQVVAGRFQFTRQTAVISSLFAVAAVLMFLFVPDRLLIALGR